MTPASDRERLEMIAMLHDGPQGDCCSDPECSICAILCCPFAEPLHFHHDGCPACSTLTPEPQQIPIQTYYAKGKLPDGSK